MKIGVVILAIFLSACTKGKLNSGDFNSSSSDLGAPTNLRAVSTSPTSIRLTWNDNSKDESGFEIERATSVSGPYEFVASVDSNNTGYDDTSVLAGATYYYRVSAVVDELSGPSDTRSASTTP